MSLVSIDLCLARFIDVSSSVCFWFCICLSFFVRSELVDMENGQIRLLEVISDDRGGHLLCWHLALSKTKSC
jgi:hypothetical protein